MASDERRAERPPRGAGRRRRTWPVSVVAIITAVAALSPLALPHQPSTERPDLPLLVEAFEDRARSDFLSARPPYIPEPDGPLTVASPPGPLSDRALVSKTIPWGDRQLPYLVPDTALPFRYHVDRELTEMYGLERVIEAMSQWDGIPGSRWQTEFVNVVDHPEPRPRADGTPVVYFRERCPEGVLGGAFWNVSPARAHVELRYGTAALYSPQIDIGICPGVDPDRLDGVIAHELGHVMGMAHLCEPGEVCWEPSMADDERRCRPMYHRFGPCRDGLTPADFDAARHLYPTLPRLYGPTPAETAARASYALTETRDADDVVLARLGQNRFMPVLGAALAGALDAPLLLSELVPEACLEDAARDELARAAAGGATLYLLGDWPEDCASQLDEWGLDVALLPQLGAGQPLHSSAIRASVEIADVIAERRQADDDAGPDSALLVTTDDHPNGLLAATVAAAAAGRRGVPLLVTDPNMLSGPVERWLIHHPTVRRIIVVDREAQIAGRVHERLWGLGTTPVELLAEEPVSFATTMASREWPYAAVRRWEDPVVLGPVGALPTAATAASVAARLGAPLLLTGVQQNDTVTRWLGRHRPLGGFLVGTPRNVPYPVQWAYTIYVRPGDPAPAISHDAGAAAVLGTHR